MVITNTKKCRYVMVNIVVIGLLLCGQYYVQQQKVHAKDLINSHAKSIKEAEEEVKRIEEMLPEMEQSYEYAMKHVAIKKEEKVAKEKSIEKTEAQIKKLDKDYYEEKKKLTDILFWADDEQNTQYRITFDPFYKKVGYYENEKTISDDAKIFSENFSIQVMTDLYETYKPTFTHAEKTQVVDTVYQIENYNDVRKRINDEKDSIERLSVILNNIKKTLVTGEENIVTVFEANNNERLIFDLDAEKYTYYTKGSEKEYRNLSMQSINGEFTLKFEKLAASITSLQPYGTPAEKKAVIDRVKEFNLHLKKDKITTIRSSIISKRDEVELERKAIGVIEKEIAERQKNSKLAHKQEMLVKKQKLLAEKQKMLAQEVQSKQRAKNEVEAKRFYQNVICIVIVILGCILMLIFFIPFNDEEELQQMQEDENVQDFNYPYDYRMV